MKAIDAIGCIFEAASWDTSVLHGAPPYAVHLSDLSVAFYPLTDSLFTIRCQIAQFGSDESVNIDLLKHLCKLSAGIILERRQRIIHDKKLIYLELEIDAHNLDDDSICSAVSDFLDDCDLFKEQAASFSSNSSYSSGAWSMFR